MVVRGLDVLGEISNARQRHPAVPHSLSGKCYPTLIIVAISD
jgi:hypothetical protein